MARGRRPKPTALRLIQGNPGKRALPRHEAKPRRRLPSCPGWLKPAARAEWARIGPELVRLGIATMLDLGVLAAYCQEFAHWQECEAQVEADGAVMVMRNDKGEVKWAQPSPHAGLALKHLDKMRALAIELGFTPAARSRVNASPENEAVDPFAEFLTGGKAQA